MAVNYSDINNARRLAGVLRSLATQVEEAWNDRPAVPALWVGTARDEHKRDLTKIDKRVGVSAGKFRSAANRLDEHADALWRQWQYEQDPKKSPFGKLPFGQTPFG